VRYDSELRHDRRLVAPLELARVKRADDIE